MTGANSAVKCRMPHRVGCDEIGPNDTSRKDVKHMDDRSALVIDVHGKSPWTCNDSIRAERRAISGREAGPRVPSGKIMRRCWMSVNKERVLRMSPEVLIDRSRSSLPILGAARFGDVVTMSVRVRTRKDGRRSRMRTKD